MGFAIGVVLAVVNGIFYWLETPSTSERAGIPLTTYHSDRTVTLIQCSIAGALTGLTAGLVAGLKRDLAAGLIFGPTAGVVMALFVGLIGTNRAWLYTVLAARCMALTGRLPWRLMGFLDDARRLGLLRTVGPAYQFRHAELQDYLTSSHLPRHSSTRAALERPRYPGATR